ncbi:MAG: hypothetical protein AABX03_03690 [Nanoarchaeota archaeon]
MTKHIKQINGIEFGLLSEDYKLSLTSEAKEANYWLLLNLAEVIVKENQAELIEYENRSFGIRFPGRKASDIAVSSDHGVVKAYGSSYEQFATELAQRYRALTAHRTTLDKRDYFGNSNSRMVA